MILTRGLSLILAFAGVAFCLLSASASVEFLTPYSSWFKVDAVVDQIDVHPHYDKGYGSVAVKLHYRSGLADRSSWATRTLPQSRAERFVREYAVGTRHTVRIDPSSPASVEVEGWNLEVMIMLLFLWIFSTCLLIAARYYWRFR
jgi:Protein of unknown function (DUF3592)